MTHNEILCPYCGRPAVLESKSVITGNPLHSEPKYICSGYPLCDSYVGVHSDTLIPFGTLADKRLRRKRIETHRIFDTLWQSGLMTRSQAYKWMQQALGLSEEQAHIGCFDENMCDRLIQEIVVAGLVKRAS